MATQRERNEAAREQKLRDVDEAIESGTLVVRSMTPAERKRFPPKNREPRRGRPSRR